MCNLKNITNKWIRLGKSQTHRFREQTSGYQWGEERQRGNTGMRECVLSHFSCVWLFVTTWTVAHQAPLSMGFSRQEYQSGLPCPSPGDLPGPGIKPVSLALQVDSLSTQSPGKPNIGVGDLKKDNHGIVWNHVCETFIYFLCVKLLKTVSTTVLKSFILNFKNLSFNVLKNLKKSTPSINFNQ